jgi:hypothetical protein
VAIRPWPASEPVAMLPPMLASRVRVALFRSPSSALRLARASIIGWMVVSTCVGTACNRTEREPSPAGSAVPSAEPLTIEQPSLPSISPDAIASAAAAVSSAKVDSATSTACNTDADCRVFSDSCGTCSCRPLAKTSADPKCAGKRTSCLIDPCTGQRAFCRKGNCAVGDPGDAATSDAAPTDAKSAASKDAASPDVATKAPGSAAPASTTPKSGDAARD